MDMNLAMTKIYKKRRSHKWKSCGPSFSKKKKDPNIIYVEKPSFGMVNMEFEYHRKFSFGKVEFRQF